MTEVVLVNSITRETEKAIQIDYCGERLIWIPKSLVRIEGDVVWCKKWFAKKNAIGCYNRTTYLAP